MSDKLTIERGELFGDDIDVAVPECIHDLPELFARKTAEVFRIPDLIQ